MADPWEEEWDYEGAEDPGLPWNMDWNEPVAPERTGEEPAFVNQPSKVRETTVGTQKYGGGMPVERPKSRAERAGSLADPSLEGGNVPTRLAASVGTKEDIKKQLAKQFGGEGSEYEVADLEGVGMAFIHPEFTGGKYQLLDPVGVDKGDFAVLAPEAAVLGGEIAGGALGSRFGPAGVTMGASAGAGLTRTGLLYGLEMAGILDNPDAITEGVKEGGLALVGGAVPSAARKVKQIFSPTDKAFRSIDPPIGRDLEVGEQRVSDLITEGEEKLADTGAPFTAGETIAAAEGGQEIGERIMATERSASDQAPFDDIKRRQEKVRNDIVDSLRQTDEVNDEAVGEVLINRARQDRAIDEAEIVDTVGREVEQTYNHIDELLASDGATGGTIRETLQTGRDRVYSRISEQYEGLWENVPPGTQPDLSGLQAAAVEWQGKLDRQVFQTLAEEDRGIVADALKAVERSAKTGSDLGDLQRDLTKLKKERLKLGLIEGMGRQKDIIDDFVVTIEAARYEALNKIDPDLAEGVLALDRAWATAKNDIDEGLAGSILTKKRGDRYSIEDDKVLEKVISNRDDLIDYIDVTRRYPETNAIPDLKGAMRAKYNTDVIDGGVSHRAFMRKNKPAMKELYTEKEMEGFTSAHKANMFIKGAEARERKMLADLQKTFGGKVARFDPDQALAYGRKSATNAKRLKRILPSDEWKVYQNYRRKNFVESITRGENVSSKTLDDALEGGRYDELTETLGANYMNDVRKLRKLMAATAKKSAQGLQQPVSEQAIDPVGFIKGMIFGPLTAIGYKIGRTQRFTTGRVNQKIELLLQDPELLKAALQTKDASLRNRKWWNLMSALGFNTGAMAMDANDPNIPIVDQDTVRELVK